MTVGDRIRKRRLELNMSQSELAAKVKYSDKTRISKLENSGDDISMKQVKRVAEALDTTPAYLMGWSETPIANEIPKLENYHMATVESNFAPPFRRSVTVKVEKPDIMLPDENIIEIQEAKRLYEMYSQAPPEIQAAVETLLKATKSDF